MIILTADDYAMTDGVSRAIEDLARARRLSATSAMVTMPGWREAAPRIAALRGEIAIGLHLNLTVGAPLGPMPKLAPDGIFPSLKSLLARSLTPLLSPSAETREGYVPNVVYTCGALKHGDKLFVPYGVADSSVSFALFDSRAILASLG